MRNKYLAQQEMENIESSRTHFGDFEATEQSESINWPAILVRYFTAHLYKLYSLQSMESPLRIDSSLKAYL